MTIQHHPDASTLLSYAAGTLSEALSVTVAAHLALCPSCRKAVRAAEAAGGAELDLTAAAPLEPDSLEHMMARIESPAGRPASRTTAAVPQVSDPRVPAPLARHVGPSLDDIRWRWVAPGVHTHEIALPPDAGHLILLRIASGKAMPEHGHGGTELTLVLSGSYTDKTGRYAAGDIADLDEDLEHSPIVDSPEDCICLVATEAPTRFKSLIGRMLQPYFRI